MFPIDPREKFDLDFDEYRSFNELSIKVSSGIIEKYLNSLSLKPYNIREYSYIDPIYEYNLKEFNRLFSRPIFQSIKSCQHILNNLLDNQQITILLMKFEPSFKTLYEVLKESKEYTGEHSQEVLSKAITILQSFKTEYKTLKVNIKNNQKKLKEDMDKATNKSLIERLDFELEYVQLIRQDVKLVRNESEDIVESENVIDEFVCVVKEYNSLKKANKHASDLF
jgi:hypothetical protein